MKKLYERGGAGEEISKAIGLKFMKVTQYCRVHSHIWTIFAIFHCSRFKINREKFLSLKKHPVQERAVIATVTILYLCISYGER